ncbi:SLC35A3 [Bugula neritina]|uniref:SLC35A3 n=1 Tax=Bugula neritina TaxID=10212 RepID=A0A7J7IYX2_BUGNE|nr:SLC35A3 [Bugula neritina]
MTGKRVALHMKYASLSFLSLQTASHVVATRYSRATNRDSPYLPSTVVALVEIFKMLITLSMLFAEKGYSFSTTLQTISCEVLKKPRETIKLSVPALLYVIQNSLLFVALSNLDSATYQVCYQLKILTTALLSVAMLHKRLRISQWFALILLTSGVVLVQLAKSEGAESAAKSKEGSVFIGLLTVVAASCLSGFSGVYFEKVLKGSNQSLWIRNVQLGGFSIVIAFASIYVKDGETVAANGFFQGYTYLTWLIILLGVLSGITVALVVKYADNILKGFATSISILISTLVSFYFLDDFEPSFGFFIGATLVIFATFLYGIEFGKK